MVDFKNILESFAGVAAVLAVDLTVEHGDDRYRVIDGNDAYKRTVVQSLDEFEKDVPYILRLCATAWPIPENLYTLILISNFITAGWKFSIFLLHLMIQIENISFSPMK